MSEQHGGSPGDQFGSIWGNTKTKVSLFQVTMTSSWLIDQIYNLHCCYFWSLNINFMSHQRERYLKSNLTILQSHNVPQADCESNPCCSPITCRSPSRSWWSWSPRSLPSWSWWETQLWSVFNSSCPDWRSTPSAASAPVVTTAGSAPVAPCAGPIRRKYPHHHYQHHHYQHQCCQQKCCCLGQMLLPWLFSSKAFTFKQFLSHYAMLLNMQTQFVCLPLGLTNYLREGGVWQQFCPFHEICLQGNLGGGIT